jgi:hypothetical protein
MLFIEIVNIRGVFCSDAECSTAFDVLPEILAALIRIACKLKGIAAR